MLKETTLLDGAIRVRLEIPLGRDTRPALISLLGDTRPIVAAGFAAATYRIDWRLLRPTPPPVAGERAVGRWVLLSASAALLGERYLREIAAMGTRYVPLIIDWLQTVPEIDPERIGMAGGSTNGFVTLQAVAADTRLGAAVAIAACGDYHLFLRDSSMGMNGLPLALDPEYSRWLETQELARHPERALPTALLMVNRSGDPLIPIACADVTARALAETYANAGMPERFRYVRYEQSGHGIGPDTRRDTMEWVRTWLRP